MAIEIPGYKLLKTLGRGGMATVFLAEQKILERRVALKVMSRSLAQDPTFGKRFVREAKIVSQLVHPNIVNVHDVGNYKGLYYLSMQYVDGQDLKAMRSSLSIRQKLQAVRDIAKALDYAGGKGYVHRDIKPENILLDSNDGRAILTDFGIAKAVNNDMAMTQTGTAIGTPHYMSPEQAKGLEVDHRADIYSLGVVFYLLLTGSLPYDAESAVAIGIKHITEPVPLLPPALSQLQHIIDSMMAKRVVERFQSASDVVFSIDEVDLDALEHTVELAQQMGQTFTEHDYESDTAIATSIDGESVDMTPREGGLSFAESGAERPQEIAQSFTIVYSADDIQEKNHRFLWLVVGLIAIAITLGAVLKYYPHKINAALESLGVAPLLPTAHVRGLESRERLLDPSSANTDLSGRLVSSSHAAKIEDLQRQIGQMNQKFLRDPKWLSDLVGAYRRLIELDPINPNAKKALFDVLTASQARAFKLAKTGNEKAAFELAARISVLFPEVKKTQLAYIESRIEQLLYIEKKLRLIDSLLQKKTLTTATIKDLLGHFSAVFAIDENHTEALASRAQFVKRLIDRGEAHFAKKRYNKANSYAQTALEADADSYLAQVFSQKIHTALHGSETIDLLLKRAKTASSNAHYFHPRAGSAFSYYSQVLDIDAANRTAKKGLSFIFDAFKKQISELVKNDKLVTAKTRIEFAQKSASQSKELARYAAKWLPKLNDKIASSILKIENIMLSVSPQVKPSNQKNNTLVPSKKIYAVFTYSGLNKQLAQLTIKLYFSRKRVLLGQTTVRLEQKNEQKNGQSQIMLESPVSFFEVGDYEMIIFEGETMIANKRFKIASESLL